MTPYEVPLSAQPEQFFITLADKQYQLLCKWNYVSQCWVLDISSDDGTPLLLALPLVTGIDLVEQHRYLGIGGSLFVQSDIDLNAVPQFDNLGTVGHLYFVVP